MDFLPRHLIYLEGDPPALDLSGEELSGLKEMGEEGEGQDLPIQELVLKSNEILQAFSGRLTDLGADFQATLHDNIVQYFLTSAEQYDQDLEQGLDKVEFETFSQDMLSGLKKIIEQYAPTEEQLRAREDQREATEQAEQAAEQMDIQLDSLDFDEANLQTPEGVQTELFKFHQHGIKLQDRVARFTDLANDVYEAYEKFETSKREWSVFLRGNSFFGMQIGWARDYETEGLQSSLRVTQQSLDRGVKIVKGEKDAMNEYGKKLGGSSDEMKNGALVTRNEQIVDLQAKNEEIDTSRAQKARERGKLEEKKDQITQKRGDLQTYLDSLTEQKKSVESGVAVTTDKQVQIGEYNQNLDNALGAFDKALSDKNLTPEKKAALQAKRKQILAGKKVVEEGGGCCCGGSWGWIERG